MGAQTIGKQQPVGASTVGTAPTVTARTESAKGAETPTEISTSTYDAAQASLLQPTQAAQGTLDARSIASAAGPTLTERAQAAGRDTAAEQRALGTAAQRPTTRDYAAGVTTDQRFTVEGVEGPAVITREGATISEEEINRLSQIAQGRGVALEDLPEYKNVIQKRIAQQGTSSYG